MNGKAICHAGMRLFIKANKKTLVPGGGAGRYSGERVLMIAVSPKAS